MLSTSESTTVESLETYNNEHGPLSKSGTIFDQRAHAWVNFLFHHVCEQHNDHNMSSVQYTCSQLDSDPIRCYISAVSLFQSKVFVHKQNEHGESKTICSMFAIYGLLWMELERYRRVLRLDYLVWNLPGPDAVCLSASDEMRLLRSWCPIGIRWSVRRGKMQRAMHVLCWKYRLKQNLSLYQNVYCRFLWFQGLVT